MIQLNSIFIIEFIRQIQPNGPTRHKFVSTHCENYYWHIHKINCSFNKKKIVDSFYFFFPLLFSVGRSRVRGRDTQIDPCYPGPFVESKTHDKYAVQSLNSETPGGSDASFKIVYIRLIIHTYFI